MAANAIVYAPVKNFQVSLLSKFVGEQFMSNTEAQSSKLASYFLNDLNLIYTINTDSIFDKVVFTALVNNILNKKVVSNGYYYTFDDDYSNPGTISTVEGAGFYPQAGTNFLLGATFHF